MIANRIQILFIENGWEGKVCYFGEESENIEVEKLDQKWMGVRNQIKE